MSVMKNLYAFIQTSQTSCLKLSARIVSLVLDLLKELGLNYKVMDNIASFYIGVILLYILLGIIFGIVVSLIFRPYVLWYFKINMSDKLQEDIIEILSELSSKVSTRTSSSISNQEHSSSTQN